MHRASPAPGVDIPVDDGDLLRIGALRLKVMHTPGHTPDSMCLIGADRVWTGDTLLIGATGRTDLPGGNAAALHDSLFQRLLKLDPALTVYPAHDYKGRSHSTIGAELANNPRLQQRDRAAFVEMMQGLNLTMPKHLTEALRVNMTGGKSVEQMLKEAAATVPFMSLEELRQRLRRPGAEPARARRARARRLRGRSCAGRDAAAARPARAAGQRLVARPYAAHRRVLRVWAHLHAGRQHRLRTMGYQRAVALDDGLQAWREAGFPLRSGAEP